MGAEFAEALSSRLSVAAAVLRFVSYSATLVTAGGMLFVVAIADRRDSDRPRLARGVTLAAVIAVLATLAGVGLQAAALTGRGTGALEDTQILGAIVESTFGTSAVVRVAALAVVAVTVTFAWRSWALALGLGAALAASGSFLLTGHTVEAEPFWLAVGSALTHTVAAAAWFGGLVFLSMTLRARAGDGDAPARAAVVARFSAMATVAVVAVSIAGAARVPTVMQVDAAALGTAYGVTLAVKVVLIGLVFLVAGYNHRRLVPAVRAAQGDGEQRLRTTITIEASALVAVIVLSAVLADLSPPGPPSASAVDSPQTTARVSGAAPRRQ